MVLFYFISALLLIIGFLAWRRPGITHALLMAFGAVQVGFTVYAALHVGMTDLHYFTYDSLGILFLGVLTLISLAVIFHGLIYFHHEGLDRYYFYHGALIGLIVSISLAYLANDVTVVWILVEATTLTASVLIYHEKTAHALEATWKYLFLCSAGIAFAYMGILFLSLTTKGYNLDGLSFANVSQVAANANPLYLKIAFLFVFNGYSTKMELFPMHTVAIDANSVAPAPIGALLSTGLANLGFVSIFRVYQSLEGSAIREWMNHIFVLAGVLSVLVAAGYMLKARHHKRMLAYSSLEVMGMVAIAIGIGGKGHYAAILLLVVHALVKSTLFFQFGQLYRILRVLKITESGNYMKINPSGGVVLLLGVIAILAIPPSGLFIGEYLIFTELVNTHQWWILAITMMLLCFVLYAMATRFMHILFSDPSEPTLKTTEPGTVKPWETLLQYTFLLLSFVLCFYQPEWLGELIVGIIK